MTNDYAARKQSAAQARGQWIEQQEAAEAAFVQEMQAEQKRRDAEAQVRQQAFDLARWKQEDFAEGARWEAQQAYQRYRAGERASYEPAAQPKSLWQRAGEWLQQKVVQPVQDFVTRWSEPPAPSGPLYPKWQMATAVLEVTGLALDKALTGGRLTKTALQMRTSVHRFVENHPTLQTVLNIGQNLAHFGAGFVLQTADDLTFGLLGRLSGIQWENGSQAFQNGRSWGRIATNVWGQIETAAGLALTAASMEFIPPTAGGAAACAALTGGGCLPLGGAALAIETAGVLAGTALTAQGSAMLMRNAGNPVSRADDPTLRYGSNTGNTRRNAQILQQNMERATGQTKPAGYHTHHIIPSTSQNEYAHKAREILEQWGIDINSAENGVFLPESIHNGLANDHTYMRAVTEDLQRANSRQDAIKILQDIGQQLLEGTYPRAGR